MVISNNSIIGLVPPAIRPQRPVADSPIPKVNGPEVTLTRKCSRSVTAQKAAFTFWVSTLEQWFRLGSRKGFMRSLKQGCLCVACAMAFLSISFVTLTAADGGVAGQVVRVWRIILRSPIAVAGSNWSGRTMGLDAPSNKRGLVEPKASCSPTTERVRYWNFRDFDQLYADHGADSLQEVRKRIRPCAGRREQLAPTAARHDLPSVRVRPEGLGQSSREYSDHD
jgi:hypothetical protein